MCKVPKEAVWRQVVTFTPVYTSVFMYGCAIGWLPNAIYFLLSEDGVNATISQCALVISFTEIGRLVFAIPAGILTEKYGRKKITICVAFLIFFAWSALSLTKSLTVIYAARLIIGSCTALNNATALTIIGETASAEIRGRLSGIYQIFLSAGVISTSIINVIFYSYKSLALGITLLSVINLISMILMSETPSFLLTVSKLEEARNNLRRIRKGYPENEINHEFEKLQKYIEEEKIRKKELGWVQFLKSKAIRKPLITGTLISFFYILTGGILISAYSTVIFPSTEYIPKIYYPLIIQIAAFSISISTPLYIDKFPRRNSFLFGSATMIITNSACALGNHFLIENKFVEFFKCIFALGNFLSSFCFNAVILPMCCALRSELYPQAVKGFCGSLAVISEALAGILMNQLYGFFQANSQLYFVYITLALSSFILFLVIYFLLPETGGLSLPDLQMKFNENISTCNNINEEKNVQK